MGHTQTDANPALSKEKTRCLVLSENVGDNNRCDSLGLSGLVGKGLPDDESEIAYDGDR
jgi:hypothetical protein